MSSGDGSETRPPRLAVIVISYNVRDLLRTCLASVFASAQHSRDHLRVEVLVVDNGSVDGSAAMVAAEYPQVRLLAVEENLGFTGGNNLALRALGFAMQPPAGGAVSAPEFVLLLNPDAEVLDDGLLHMVTALRDLPAAAACGARLQYGDGRFQHGAFHFPGLAQVALDILPLARVPGVRRLLPRLLDSRLNGRYPARLWRGGVPFRVDFVLGAALMVRRETIEQVGLLDESFFMYCEEMDWCLRMTQHGGTIWAVPAARVVHYEGQSSRQRPWRSFERLWRSRLRFYHKHNDRHGWLFLVALRLLLRLGLALRAQAARRSFGDGALCGRELARELTSYRALRNDAG